MNSMEEQKQADPVTFRFSGHETFPCRYTRLPKVVRGLRDAPAFFSDEDAANDRTLVIRWPGGSHWVGRGIRSFHPASTDVLHKDHDGKCSLLISWNTGRRDRHRPGQAANVRRQSNP